MRIVFDNIYIILLIVREIERVRRERENVAFLRFFTF